MKKLSIYIFLILAVLYLSPYDTKAASLVISPRKARIEHGQSIRLKVKEEVSDISYTTKDIRIIQINRSGFIVGLKPGTATVMVKANHKSAKCKITVKKPSITIEKKRIQLRTGKRKRLSVWVSSGYHPIFKSLNKKIAVVNDLGYITALHAGTTTIKISFDGVTKTCLVKVTP